MFSNRVYDILKYIAQIVLPALGAMYYSLGQIWEWGNATNVVGTITVVDAFLGAVLGLSTMQYNKSDEKFDGQITVHETEHDEGSTLNVSIDPSAVGNKSEVTLKVEKPS